MCVLLCASVYDMGGTCVWKSVSVGVRVYDIGAHVCGSQYVRVCVCMILGGTCVQKPENRFVVLSFHFHVDSGDPALVIKLV